MQTGKPDILPVMFELMYNRWRASKSLTEEESEEEASRKQK